MKRLDVETPGSERHPVGARFWVTAAIGWAIIAVGLRGILTHRLDTRPANLAKFVIGGALIHDLVVAPVVIVAAVVLARVLPGRARAAVDGALLVTAALALFSYPLVRAYARVIHNPTSLPRNYTANLVLVLGVVWVVTAVVVVVRLRSGGRRAP